MMVDKPVHEGGAIVMADLNDIVEKVQDTLGNLTPTPVILEDESTAADLKQRLEWAEPALTIVDIRDRDRFNHSHIMGAMSMPLDQFEQMATSTLQKEHDIYIYGESDEQALEAAVMLRNHGYMNVTQISGGLDSWYEIAGPTEGIDDSMTPPDANAYNIVSRLKTEQQVRDAEKAQQGEN